MNDDKKPREWNKIWSNCESHAHDKPGHWDSDNGDKSGTVCELCYRWNAFEEIEAENERLNHRYKSIELANKELSRNDHVNFGELIKENGRLEAKLAEVEAERERLEDLLGAVHDTTLEADTKSRIANNLDATPNGWRFRKSQLTREREAVKSLSAQLEWSLKNEAQYKNAMKKAFEVETVMREALIRYRKVSVPSYSDGTLNTRDRIYVAEEALAKADEIRGGE